MPIPFHDDETIEELGIAAFLHLELSGETLLGGLLFLNARGEPLEFVFNRLELLSEVLWRPADRLPAGKRRLATTLFQAATLSPSFLLIKTGTAPQLFGEEAQIALAIPVGSINAGGSFPDVAAIETFDAMGEIQTIQMSWSPQAPEATAGKLFALLAERGLILEPFARAEAGLREVYDKVLEDAD